MQGQYRDHPRAKGEHESFSKEGNKFTKSLADLDVRKAVDMNFVFGKMAHIEEIGHAIFEALR